MCFLLVALLIACQPQIPTTFDESNKLPPVYPDYTNVTIPVNIAPLTFELDEEADEMVARYSVADGTAITCAGKMQPDIDDWQQIIAAALKSQTSNPIATPHSQREKPQISVDVYARHGDRWTHYKPFQIYVSPDSIDPYISYRLIPPSFISYEALTINQRCLENYDEEVIYDNMLCGLEKDGQCINCHSYQQYNPARMQFHARQSHGGTIIAYDGAIKKVNMKNDSILSAGVYPAWHPWLKLIVYSTDKTYQNFHTTDRNKIEVYDTASDLIAYNVSSDEVTNIENDPDEMEVFPAWAPDGRTLYYCSAHFVRNKSIENATADVVSRIDSLHYNIYRKSFDPETMEFGPRELVFDAGKQSAVLPRISPDGRYMLFTMAARGYFHIWHRDADLWMMDLGSDQREVKSDHPAAVPGTIVPGVTAHPVTELNSNETESYHTWSANGRWIVFSSRRDDGVFTRPFFAHVDDKGHCSKPFELPCADPDYHRQFMRSYNIPEFMSGRVIIGPHKFANVLKGEGVPVKYVNTFNKSQISNHK